MAATPALSHLSADALRHRMACYPSHVARLGLEYADAGRVEDVRFVGPAVAAQVRGRRHSLYTVHWTWTGNAWLGNCSCPVARECKHLYAVAVHALAPRAAAPPGVGALRSAREPWRRAQELARLLHER